MAEQKQPDSSLERMNETLKRMLKTPPKPLARGGQKPLPSQEREADSVRRKAPNGK